MKQGMNEQAFNDLVSMFDTKLGFINPWCW